MAPGGVWPGRSRKAQHGNIQSASRLRLGWKPCSTCGLFLFLWFVLSWFELPLSSLINYFCYNCKTQLSLHLLSSSWNMERDKMGAHPKPVFWVGIVGLLMQVG